MAKGLYRLKKPENKHTANQVPGRHEIKGGKVVSHDEPQEFDPEVEGIAQYCEPVTAPAKPAPKTTLPSRPAE
jgi:hypothetical protein